MLDSQARKQLLLTRIAFERDELSADVARLRGAANLPAMFRSAFGPGRAREWFKKKPGKADDWISLAFGLLRRYRVAATVLGGLLPMLGRRDRRDDLPAPRRRGRGLRRLVLAAVLGGATWVGWRFSSSRGRAG